MPDIHFDVQSTRSLAARSLAIDHPGLTGLLRFVSHGYNPSGRTYVINAGEAAYFRCYILRRPASNGICFQCGTVIVQEQILRAMGPHPMADQLILPTRYTRGPSVVAEFGLTWACRPCSEKYGLQAISDFDLQVHRAPWFGFETPKSKIYRQFRMLPLRFSWERDFPMYITADLDSGIATAAPTLWE